MTDAVSTRALNHEPIAMLGLTQSELTVVTTVSIGISVPTGIVIAIIVGATFGFMYGMLALLAVSGLLGLLLGWLLSRWVQKNKADTPSGFLKQRMQLRFERKKWLPALGIFHYRRTGDR
jgi:conjugative transfer region protein (TIGR03750 family)